MTDPTNTNLAYQRLFKNHGSSVGFWEGWVEVESKDKAHIVLQYARTMDGKVTRKIHPVSPKNVGRSNETTALEQAQLELDSRAKKQLDKGYVERQEDASKPSTNTLGLLKPMLAKPIDKVDPDKIDWSEAFAQKKLDGHRAMWKDGVLYSRQGKEIDLPHIAEAIKTAGIDHLHLDGELYLHGKTLQEISSLVKRHQEGTEDLVYHVYDVVDDRPWQRRINGVVEALYALGEPVQGLELLRCRKVPTFEDLQAYHEENLSAGYEGTMLRWGSAGYQDGKRSKHLLKMKEFECDSEFKITGFRRGVPYVTSKGTFEVPVWVCDAGNGKTFTCTAQGDMYEKHALWETREDHVGKQLTVKYHYLSKDGVPQLPVSLRFREDI